MLRNCAAAAALLVMSTALAACTAESPGIPTPAPESSSGTGSAPANPAAPKVSVPLDAAAYLSDPCKVIPAAVLAELGYTDAGRPRAGESNPTCGWSIRGKGKDLQVIIGSGNRSNGTGGLAGLYAAKERGRMPFVEAGPEVDGYPTVFYGLADDRAEGECDLSLGVADDLAIATLVSGYENAQDSCETAQKLSSAVVKTLKGA